MLIDVVREAAARFGDTIAYVAPNGWEVSYRDLDRLSDEVGAGMQRAGVNEGDVVALVLPQSPEYAIAYLAAAKIGAVTAGVNTRLSEPERQAVLFVANPCLVLATEELAPDAFDTTNVRLAGDGAGAFAGLRLAGAAPPPLPPAPH